MDSSAPEPDDVNWALMETLEQTRLATEAVERRVNARRQRITHPYLEAIVERLPPPPALPGETEELRARRSEAPTQRLRSVMPASPTQYSFIERRGK